MKFKPSIMFTKLGLDTAFARYSDIAPITLNAPKLAPHTRSPMFIFVCLKINNMDNDNNVAVRFKIIRKVPSLPYRDPIMYSVLDVPKRSNAIIAR